MSRWKSSGSCASAVSVNACQLNAANSIANGGKYSAKRFERNWAASSIVANVRKNAAFSGSLPFLRHKQNVADQHRQHATGKFVSSSIPVIRIPFAADRHDEIAADLELFVEMLGRTASGCAENTG